MKQHIEDVFSTEKRQKEEKRKKVLDWARSRDKDIELKELNKRGDNTRHDRILDQGRHALLKRQEVRDNPQTSSFVKNTFRKFPFFQKNDDVEEGEVDGGRHYSPNILHRFRWKMRSIRPGGTSALCITISVVIVLIIAVLVIGFIILFAYRHKRVLFAAA